MDKQQKNVYPNQTQSVNYNMMNHLQMAPPQHPVPQLYQSPMAGPLPQVPMYYSHPSSATYQQQIHPSQQMPFMMGPPPEYMNTPNQTYPTGYCPPPAYQPPIYNAPQAGYTMTSAAPQAAVFDSGARFNGKGSVNIPPPPPGYMPNAAQLAAMQGQTVIVDKKKNNFFTGGKGGGYTFW